MKLHHALILTNLCSLGALIFVVLQPKSSTHTSIADVEQPEFRREYQSMIACGRLDVVGYERNREQKWEEKYGDYRVVKKGEPIGYVAWESWMPQVDMESPYGYNPEFLEAPGSNDWDGDTVRWGNSSMAHDGKLIYIAIPTDTVDLHGQQRKLVTVYPHMRYVVGDSIKDFFDTLKVWVEAE